MLVVFYSLIKKCLTILMVLLFFILTFSFVRNYKMSDETYGSDGFRVGFLHDKRGKLIKGNSLFNNIYGLWVCIHAARFMKVNWRYHPKTAKLEKFLRKKWEKAKVLPIINILLRKIIDGDNAFNPKYYLGKDEEQYFQILQRWKIDFEKTCLEKYQFLTRAPIKTV